jgi:hypothetical protein
MLFDAFIHFYEELITFHFPSTAVSSTCKIIVLRIDKHAAKR